MSDKTLGAYKSTTPDPDETTGEALARLQAEMTRLLDEADAELRDEADGGVAAALIEKEAEEPNAEVRELRSALAREVARGNALQDALDAAESRPLAPDAPECDRHIAHIATQDRVLRHRNRTIRDLTQERDEARRERGEALDRLCEASRPRTSGTLTDEMVDRYWAAMRHPGSNYDEAVRRALAAALDAAPDAMTAREHLDAAWEAAHVPECGNVPKGAWFLTKSTTGVNVRVATEAFGAHGVRLLDPPAPARPERAEEIEAILREEWTFSEEDGGEDAFADLAGRLAQRGVRVVGEDGAA